MSRTIIAALVAVLITAAGVNQVVGNQIFMPAIVAPAPIDTPTSTPTFVPTETPTPTATAITQATDTPTVTPTATEPVDQGPCSCAGDLYNCSSFSTHAHAQACYDFCRSQGAGDVHHLDSDGDGDACESLPLPLW
jgi:hypothetical protein